jgi:hypothetical protein
MRVRTSGVEHCLGLCECCESVARGVGAAACSGVGAIVRAGGVCVCRFCIEDKKLFTEKLLPRLCNTKSFDSFVRQLHCTSRAACRVAAAGTRRAH